MFLQAKPLAITHVALASMRIQVETVVHELRSDFGFFKLARTCETILRRRFSYDGDTKYLK
jgi:hypothetical protein